MNKHRYFRDPALICTGSLLRLNPAGLRKHGFLMIAPLAQGQGGCRIADAARIVRQQHPDAAFKLLGAVDSHNRSAIDRGTVDKWVAEGVLEY